MQPISIISANHRTIENTSPSAHRESLIAGMRALGVAVKEPPYYGDIRTKHVSCWGWRRGDVLRARGYEVLVMERGYIGDRFKYTSLGWNGLNNYAEFPQYPDDGGERFKSMGGVIKPWKKGGDYILILGQVRGDASLQRKDIAPWYQAVAAAAKKYHNLPVYFRPHPDSKRRGGYRGIEGIVNLEKGSLEAALDGALFSIAYNSNSCLDSVLAGVPCYAGDRGTMAHDLCMNDWKVLFYPSREKVVHHIAFTQWSQEEIRSGEALKKIVERMA